MLLAVDDAIDVEAILGSQFERFGQREAHTRARQVDRFPFHCAMTRQFDHCDAMFLDAWRVSAILAATMALEVCCIHNC